MAKKYPRGVVPPCPGNPTDYDLVNRNAYYYWRARKGTYKPVVLSEALLQRNYALKALSPTIKYLRHILIPYMKPLPTGSLHNNLFKWLQQSWIDTGQIDYSGMRGKELHDTYTLQKILQAVYSCTLQDHILQLRLQYPCAKAVSKPGPLVTQFALEALLLWGTGDDIRTSSRQTLLFDITEGINSECVFEFELPQGQHWLAILKLVSFEGDENAKHPKYYGMRVVEVGG